MNPVRSLPLGLAGLATVLALVPAPAPALPVAGAPVPPALELAELCTFDSVGRNPYVLLEPGWTLELEGVDEEEALIQVTVQVLDETRIVDGVETRVVFEEELEDHRLVEQSSNWFALCQESGSVFYFGEAVDIFEDGVIVSHEGSWEAGKDNARPGVLMPGQPAVGHAHLQEVAPPVAMDTAAVASVTDHIDVPAGAFDGALHVVETTPIEPGSVGEKWYAPDVGLAIDGPTELVRFGFRH